MATVPSHSAFNAFEAQLRTLCLNEFPCGGKYVENGVSKLNVHITNSKFSVTHKDYGSDFEKTEMLEELVKAKKSPWNLDYSWSEEARTLREIAVKSPWLIDDRFVLSHFKTLRIIDQNVSDVDENFQKFKNLQQLILSANHLKTVKSVNLPQNLEVLELCANEISHLEDLCIKPVPLIHLGLGHNLLSSLDVYITGQYWPNLLSLDLSSNNLVDLIEVVCKLQSLPKLRNLILQGNPLSLVPSYRGYVIDSLRDLEFLDDTPLSADEKHHYKGLARHKEFILDEAKITLQVDFIRGLLQPDELRFPDEQPEFPITTHKYYVEFMFLGGQADRAELLKSPCTVDTQETDHDTQVKDQDSQEKDEDQDITAVEMSSCRSVNFACETPQTIPEQADNSVNKLVAVKCESSSWQEDIEINWHQMLLRDDLLSLRDFFRDGIDINMIEEKIVSYPADQVQDGVVSPGPTKDKKKDKKDDKKKEDDAKKKKKKKGEPDIEMTHMPSEYTSLAKFHIPTDNFLEGEFVFENVFIKSWEDRLGTQTPMSDVSTSSRDKKKKGDKKKEKDSRKSPKTERKGSGKDKNDKKKSTIDAGKDDELEAPPLPLEVHIKVKLHHWRTAADALTDKQEMEQEMKSISDKDGK